MFDEQFLVENILKAKELKLSLKFIEIFTRTKRKIISIMWDQNI